MLMIGVLDAGRGVLAAAVLANAVREGARAGVAAYPAAGWDTSAANRVRSTISVLDPSALTLTVVQTTDANGTFVTVTAQYQFRTIAPYITLTPSSIPLSSSSRMLVS